RKRIVMATLGSFGDVHPYVALALEMKNRGVDPVIVTGEAYRKKFESLGIAFRPMRPRLPGVDDLHAGEMGDRVLDPKRGAEYLFRDLLLPALSQSYQDLEAAIQGADLLVTHPMSLVGPPLAQKTGIPWVSTVLAPSSLWSDHDPFVPPNAPWFESVLRFG